MTTQMVERTSSTPVGMRAPLRSFLEERLVPRVPELERDGVFPDDVFRALGAEGFFAPCVRSGRDARGMGVELAPFRVLIEELARTRCFGLTLAVSIHVGVFLPMVARLARDPVRSDVLERGLRGNVLGAFAATDRAAAGSDFAGMETAIAARDGGYVVDGAKDYIANGAVADYAIVFGRSRPGRDFTSFSAVLVPTDAPGVRSRRIDMGVMRTAVTGSIELDHVAVDGDHLLGRAGLGLAYFLEHVVIERLAGGIWAVASGEQCLLEAYRYARERVVGDTTLWARSSVRHRIARAASRLSLLRSHVDALTSRAEATGGVDELAAAVLKATVAPIMEEVLGTCVQLSGARGLEADSPTLRLLNDFRVFGVAGGSTETMLDVVAETWVAEMEARDQTSGGEREERR